MQPAVRPRPRGQAPGQEPAREDAGAPIVFIFQFVRDKSKCDTKFFN